MKLRFKRQACPRSRFGGTLSREHDGSRVGGRCKRDAGSPPRPAGSKDTKARLTPASESLDSGFPDPLSLCRRTGKVAPLSSDTASTIGARGTPQISLRRTLCRTILVNGGHHPRQRRNMILVHGTKTVWQLCRRPAFPKVARDQHHRAVDRSGPAPRRGG